MKKMFRPLGEHHVYKDQDWYIKLPKNPDFFLGKDVDYCSLLQSNIEYIREHFGDLLSVPETIIEYDEIYGYRIKQRSVKAAPVNMFTLTKNSALSKKLQQLFDRNYHLRTLTMKGLDFYGTDGLHAPHLLHNILVDEQGQLYLIDIGLLAADAYHPHFRTASRIFFHLQNAAFMSSRHTIGGLLTRAHQTKQLFVGSHPKD